MSERWQLWTNDDGQVRWFDPANRWGTKPGRPWRLIGTWTVDRVRGLGDPPPRGMLRADPSRQVFGLGGPHLLYADQQRRCRECGQRFVWSAAAQRRLFEQKRVWNDVVKRRCAACAKARDVQRATQQRLMEAHRAVAEQPDAANHLELARATLDAAEHVGRSALERAIGGARQAARDPRHAQAADAVVASLQEALAHRRASQQVS